MVGMSSRELDSLRSGLIRERLLSFAGTSKEEMVSEDRFLSGLEALLVKLSSASKKDDC